MKDYKYLQHLNVEIWYTIQIYFTFDPNNSEGKTVCEMDCDFKGISGV